MGGVLVQHVNQMFSCNVPTLEREGEKVRERESEEKQQDFIVIFWNQFPYSLKVILVNISECVSWKQDRVSLCHWDTLSRYFLDKQQADCGQDLHKELNDSCSKSSQLSHLLLGSIRSVGLQNVESICQKLNIEHLGSVCTSPPTTTVSVESDSIREHT